METRVVSGYMDRSEKRSEDIFVGLYLAGEGERGCSNQGGHHAHYTEEENEAKRH